jgi:predicted transcriptional regulator
LNLSEGTIRYHIRYLIKHNLIFKQTKKGYTRFYVFESSNIINKEILSYLRNENSRSVILFFYFYVCGSLKKLCSFLDKDKKEVHNYIKKLLDDSIIELAPVDGSEVSTGFKRCKKKTYNRSRGEKINLYL